MRNTADFLPALKRLARRGFPSTLSFLILAVLSLPARADLALETETARVLEPGHFQLGAAFEFQASRDGKEYALPMALEIGVFHHLELLIEPVPYTSIRPRGEKSATGVGDLETTLTYLVLDEKQYAPALAIAGEVKFPTAGNAQIGSGKYDYRIYLIASKRVGNFDLHFNVGYNITGSPPGVRTRNPIDLELGVEWFVRPQFDLFAEVTYVGSSAGSSKGGESMDGAGLISGENADSGVLKPSGASLGRASLTPEIAGREVVGSVGIRGHLTRTLDIFGSFSYDNNDAKLFRTGFTVKF